MYGLYHPMVVIMHNNLAMAKVHQGKYEEAMILYHNSLLIQQAMAISHPTMVESRCDLILLMREHGLLSLPKGDPSTRLASSSRTRNDPSNDYSQR